MSDNNKESKFSSKIGFILAAAGSAVGLGNLWRFPYLAAKYGGGIFLLVYIILAVTFGFALMVSEIAIGRRTRKSSIAAYGQMSPKFKFLGPIGSLVPILITPYYCVIGGWVLKYLVTFASGQGHTTTGDGSFFSNFIGSAGGATLFFLIFVLLTAVIVFAGVEKGIEGLSKILMPLLVAITIGLAIYTMTLPGAMEGVKYYFLPNTEGYTVTMFLKTIAAAMGQLFYSMSLAMGIMITYGSYMRKEDSIEKCVRNIELFDTGIAVLAGLIIVPSVFVFSGGTAESLNAGPSLMFITLPNVFDSMQGGQIVGAVFFILVALAALTSSVSLMETMVSIFIDAFKIKRIWACVISSVIIVGMGMLSVLGYSVWSDVTILGYQFLDFFDFITNNVMMPIVALITCIIIGYVVKPSWIEDEISEGSGNRRKSSKVFFRFLIKYLCPIGMLVILYTAFAVKF